LGLKIYNTLNRKKEDFKTVFDKKVRMYVCGPTVYNFISIGNARPIIVFDMVRNYLEHIGYKVEIVQNITDIEDKIINKANEEGVDFNTITDRYIKAFLEDLETLGIKNFSAMPKASEMIPEIIAIISKIIDNGYAYVSGGDVYFDVAKFPGYGKLSGRKLDEMQAQESCVFSKKNNADFALWKSSKPGEPSWASPWGNGRPGWHIECSAMSIKYLGYTLDIHGGGIDLIFPHHENEIAQSEAAFGQNGNFVKYWMHNGMVEVKDEKMSKSKGLKDDWILKNLLKKYPSDVIKMYMLSTHYRSPLEFSGEKLEEAKKALEKIISFLRNVYFLTHIEVALPGNEEKKYPEGDIAAINYNMDIEPDRFSVKIYDHIKYFKEEFKSAMDDDFNSAKAIGVLFDFISNINAIIQNSRFKINMSISESLKITMDLVLDHSRIFGFELKSQLTGFSGSGKVRKNGTIYLEDAEILELIEKRLHARKHKDFNRADQIRDELKSYGITLEDRKEGTIWKRDN